MTAGSGHGGIAGTSLASSETNGQHYRRRSIVISQLKDHDTVMEPYGHVPRRPPDAMSRSDEGHIYASAKIDGCLREPSGWGFMPEGGLEPNGPRLLDQPVCQKVND